MPFSETQCILSQEHSEHIALCHPKFGPMIAQRGIRWYADDTVPQRYSCVTVPCRGNCNVQQAVHFMEQYPMEIPDMRTLSLGLERFAMEMWLGACPKCGVVHSARSLK